MPEFKRKPLEGLFALMPLCLKETQEIDYEGIRHNIEWLAAKGIPGFIKFGCMGQMNAPSEEEFNKVCDLCVDTAKSRKIACVVSSTSPNTNEAIRRAKYAENAGADGSMLALPYAFPVTQDWAVEFYQAVDQALKGELAILVYNFPRLTGVNCSPAMWRERLLKIRSIKAVKDSNMEIPHHDEALFTYADKINAFSCADSLFWHDAMLGAKGIVGIISWVAPSVGLRYYEECRKGNQTEPWTFKAFEQIVRVFGVMRSNPSVPLASYEHGYLNALAEIGGAKAGPPRKPYGRLPREARLILEEAVKPLIEMERKM